MWFKELILKLPVGRRWVTFGNELTSTRTMESGSAILVEYVVQSDDDEVIVKKTKNVKLTSACPAYIEDAADVAIATGTAAVENGTTVATGSVGRSNMSHHKCVVKSTGRRQIGKGYTHKN